MAEVGALGASRLSGRILRWLSDMSKEGALGMSQFLGLGLFDRQIYGACEV